MGHLTLTERGWLGEMVHPMVGSGRDERPREHLPKTNRSCEFSRTLGNDTLGIKRVGVVAPRMPALAARTAGGLYLSHPCHALKNHPRAANPRAPLPSYSFLPGAVALPPLRCRPLPRPSRVADHQLIEAAATTRPTPTRPPVTETRPMNLTHWDPTATGSEDVSTELAKLT